MQVIPPTVILPKANLGIIIQLWKGDPHMRTNLGIKDLSFLADTVTDEYVDIEVGMPLIIVANLRMISISTPSPLLVQFGTRTPQQVNQVLLLSSHASSVTITNPGTVKVRAHLIYLAAT